MPLARRSGRAFLTLVLVCATCIIGGVGTATIAGAASCTINGNSGSNTLHGTSGNDVICGHGGNDVIYGHGGNDVIYGGTGDDVIYAGSGNDSAYGESGSDRVYGESGNDKTYGGTGNDTVTGGTGNDTVKGEDGNDTVRGEDGDDVVYGDGGSDRVYGDGGADKLYGGPGTDTMLGGSGDDKLYGEADGDTLDGESGTDYARGGSGFDSCSGGSGYNDTIHDFECERRSNAERLSPGVPSEACSSASLSCLSFSGYAGTSIWGFPRCGSNPHNCTLYAAYRLQRRGASASSAPTGNAYEWNNRPGSLTVATTPRVGDVAQWETSGSGTSCNGRNCGHVAYVERTIHASNGAVTAIVISESAWCSKGSIRVIQMSSSSRPTRYLRWSR